MMIGKSPYVVNRDIIRPCWVLQCHHSDRSALASRPCPACIFPPTGVYIHSPKEQSKRGRRRGLYRSKGKAAPTPIAVVLAVFSMAFWVRRRPIITKQNSGPNSSLEKSRYYTQSLIASCSDRPSLPSPSLAYGAPWQIGFFN